MMTIKAVSDIGAKLRLGKPAIDTPPLRAERVSAGAQAVGNHCCAIPIGGTLLVGVTCVFPVSRPDSDLPGAPTRMMLRRDNTAWRIWIEFFEERHLLPVAQIEPHAGT